MEGLNILFELQNKEPYNEICCKLIQHYYFEIESHKIKLNNNYTNYYNLESTFKNAQQICRNKEYTMIKKLLNTESEKNNQILNHIINLENIDNRQPVELLKLSIFDAFK